MSKFRTHYDNLKIARDAPDVVIRASYKALMQKYHPDKFDGGIDEALRVVKLIRKSYEILIDPIKRITYDQWIEEQENKFDQDLDEKYQQESDKGTEANQRPPTPPFSNKNHFDNNSFDQKIKKSFSSPNLLFLLLYGIEVGRLVAINGDIPVHLLLAEAIGICIFPLLAGVYYNISEKAGRISKFIYTTSSALILFITVASHLQEESESRSVNESKGKSNALIQNKNKELQQNIIALSPQEIFEKANILYEQGRFEQAFKLYQEINTYTGPQLALGRMYSKGEGVSKNLIEAKKWYETAASVNDYNQQDAISELATINVQIEQASKPNTENIASKKIKLVNKPQKIKKNNEKIDVLDKSLEYKRISSENQSIEIDKLNEEARRLANIAAELQKKRDVTSKLSDINDQSYTFSNDENALIKDKRKEAMEIKVQKALEEQKRNQEYLKMMENFSKSH